MAKNQQEQDNSIRVQVNDLLGEIKSQVQPLISDANQLTSFFSGLCSAAHRNKVDEWIVSIPTKYNMTDKQDYNAIEDFLKQKVAKLAEFSNNPSSRYVASNTYQCFFVNMRQNEHGLQ